MCRWVNEFSARKTGPISKTLWKSPITHICLYSCGDWARHDFLPKYWRAKTLAPPSELPAISLGVWISTKSLLVRNYLKIWQTPEETLKIACLAVVLRSMTLLSSLVFILTTASFCSYLGYSFSFFYCFCYFFYFFSFFLASFSAFLSYLASYLFSYLFASVVFSSLASTVFSSTLGYSSSY